MDAVTLILAVSPVIVVLLCAWVMRLPGDVSGLAGLITALLVSITYFQTDADIVGRSVVFGILWSLPLALFIAASMFQALFMERVGAIRRIAIFFKTFAANDKIVSAIIINIGIAAILAGFGINPLCILPLVLIGLGFSAYAAIALPAIGAAALFIYAFLGEPVQQFAFHLGGGQTFDQAGAFIVPYLWPTTFILTLGLLYVLGGFKCMRRGIIPVIITATVVWVTATIASKVGATHMTGILAGIAVMIFMCAWTRIRGNKIIDRSKLTSEDETYAKKLLFPVAILPMFLTAVFVLLTILVPPVKAFLSESASIPVWVFQSEPIILRPLYHIYFWVLVATIVCIPIYRGGFRGFKESVVLWAKRAPRPAIAIALFAATAFVMRNSGKAEMSIAHYHALILPEGHSNMIQVMQDTCTNIFGTFYPFVGTIAGLRIGFISGSPFTPISFLTRIHLEIAEVLFKPGGAGIFIAAASALAGSFMLMVNPAWLMNASAVIGKTGYEARVLRSTIIIAVIATLALAAAGLVFASR